MPISSQRPFNPFINYYLLHSIVGYYRLTDIIYSFFSPFSPQPSQNPHYAILYPKKAKAQTGKYL